MYDANSTRVVPQFQFLSCLYCSAVSFLTEVYSLKDVVRITSFLGEKLESEIFAIHGILVDQGVVIRHGADDSSGLFRMASLGALKRHALTKGNHHGGIAAFLVSFVRDTGGKKLCELNHVVKGRGSAPNDILDSLEKLGALRSVHEVYLVTADRNVRRSRNCVLYTTKVPTEIDDEYLQTVHVLIRDAVDSIYGIQIIQSQTRKIVPVGDRSAKVGYWLQHDFPLDVRVPTPEEAIRPSVRDSLKIYGLPLDTILVASSRLIENETGTARRHYIYAADGVAFSVDDTNRQPPHELHLLMNQLVISNKEENARYNEEDSDSTQGDAISLGSVPDTTSKAE